MLAVAAVLAAPLPAGADDAGDIAGQAQGIIDSARGLGLESLLPGVPVPDLSSIAPSAAGASSAPAGSPADGRHRQRYAFLVSFSDEASVKSAIERARGRNDVVVLFRGIPDTDFRAFFARLERVTGGRKDLPPIGIDPRVFRRFGLERAPATVDLQSGDILMGVLSVEALLERPGGAGDTALGPVLPIVEPDLADLLRQRAATLDPAALAARAQEAFWAGRRFVELPVAPAPRVRRIAPVVYLQRDLRTADGTLIAAAGTSVNPLQSMALTLTVIVFDALDPRQRRIAAAEAAVAPRPVLVTTRLDPASRWRGLKELQDEVGHPLYLLDEILRRRLYLERIPAVVTAEGSELVIREVAAAGEGDGP